MAKSPAMSAASSVAVARTARPTALRKRMRSALVPGAIAATMAVSAEAATAPHSATVPIDAASTR
jgi:hypothetical protein